MPKLIDLTKVPSEADLEKFRLPKWIKADQIQALIRGAMSDTEEEEEEEDDDEEEGDMVYVTSHDNATRHQVDHIGENKGVSKDDKK